MTLIDRLIRLISSKNKENTDVPDGLCPNCWGRQEYSGKFYEAAINHKVNHFDHDPKVGWVQEYVDKNLKGIELQKDVDGLVCANCKLSYKEQN